MDYKITSASEADLDFVLPLNLGSLTAVSQLDSIKMKYFLEISSYFKIFLFQEKPVGFLIGILPGEQYQSENYKWFNEQYNSFIYVDRIIIHPDYQNNGMGVYFYNHLKNTFVGQVERIACEVNIKPYNKQSINFHKKYGFNQVSERDTEDGKKRVAYMIYKINS